MMEDENLLKSRPSRARYDRVRQELERKWRRRELRADRMMREIVDALWESFEGAPYSWCGFYVLSPDGENLILGPHRDKPACSPLPLHGVCGQVLRGGKPMLVADVKTLGAAHVECDPKNVTEVAVPVFDKEGKVWAVLDVDSAEAGAFNEMDVRWLDRLVKTFSEIARPS